MIPTLRGIQTLRLNFLTLLSKALESTLDKKKKKTPRGVNTQTHTLTLILQSSDLGKYKYTCTGCPCIDDDPLMLLSSLNIESE